jgi:hypothetical protein
MAVYIQGFVIGFSVRFMVTFIFKVKRNVEKVYFLIADLARNLEIILAEKFA